jgi:hypothetical protein
MQQPLGPAIAGMEVSGYLTSGTLAAALGRDPIGLDELRGECDELWRQGSACAVTLTVMPGCWAEFNFVDDAFSHDSLQGDLAWLSGDLGPRSLLARPGTTAHVLDQEYVVVLSSGVAVHYRGPAARTPVRIDGALLPALQLRAYFDAMATNQL